MTEPSRNDSTKNFMAAVYRCGNESRDAAELRSCRLSYMESGKPVARRLENACCDIDDTALVWKVPGNPCQMF